MLILLLERESLLTNSFSCCKDSKKFKMPQKALGMAG